MIASRILLPALYLQLINILQFTSLRKRPTFFTKNPVYIIIHYDWKEPESCSAPGAPSDNPQLILFRENDKSFMMHEELGKALAYVCFRWTIF